MGKKLFIQIPCLNEEETLPAVINDLPKRIVGVDKIYTLIIDDGSTDNTLAVAKRIGIDYVVRNHRNIGLAKSFSRGLEACLFLGADIIVNTDGDNQYNGGDIPKLVKPIIEKKTDIVVGSRDIEGNPEFSYIKKKLQRIGSWVVHLLAKVNVPDATSGFRAISREAAIRFSFMSGFSYTLEMLIQAIHNGLKVDHVLIQTNRKLRESRLFKLIRHFIWEQSRTMLFLYMFYRPMHFFGGLSLFFFIISVFLSLRVIYFIWIVDAAVASFKTGSMVLLLFTSFVSVLLLIVGLLGNVLSGLRFMSMDIRARLRSIELKQHSCTIEDDICRPDNLF